MRRGEVWLINLDPTVGAEIKKTRPAFIVSDDAIGVLPLKVIVPIADAFQVRSIAQERFSARLGRVADTTIQDISRALAVVLSIEV